MNKAFTHYENLNISLQIVNILQSNFGESAVNIDEVETLVGKVRSNSERANITRLMAREAIENRNVKREVQKNG